MTISPRFLHLAERLRSFEHQSHTCTFDDVLKAWDTVTRYHVYPHLTLLEFAETILQYMVVSRHGHMDYDAQKVIVDDMIRIHHEKNTAYAGYTEDPFFNFRNALKFGVTAYTGCLIRMADKMQRYKNLYKTPELERDYFTEEDTLLDLLAYTLIAQCLYEEQGLPRYIAKDQYYDATFDGD